MGETPRHPPIRISFGITDLDVGGAEKAMVSLIERLDRSQWDPRVFCLQPLGVLSERLQTADVPVVCLNLKTSLGVPRVLWQWSRALSQFKPDVLQTFLFHANFLGSIAGRRAGVPVIATGVRVAERRSNSHVFLSKRTWRLADCHVCVSDETAKFQHEVVGIPQDRIRVIPNGIDSSFASDVRSVDWPGRAGSDGNFKLVCVGRLDRQKGVDLLLSVMQGIPDRSISLVFVGDGSERESLSGIIRDSSQSDRIHLVGWQPRPQDWIAAADVLVLASRWEGMPNVVLEAMALGKPVLATRVEGVPALIDDGITGWICEPGSSASLQSGLQRCIADRARWHEMGTAGREKVIARFSLEKVVQKYEQLWRELLAKKRGC